MEQVIPQNGGLQPPPRRFSPAMTHALMALASALATVLSLWAAGKAFTPSTPVDPVVPDKVGKVQAPAKADTKAPTGCGKDCGCVSVPKLDVPAIQRVAVPPNIDSDILMGMASQMVKMKDKIDGLSRQIKDSACKCGDAPAVIPQPEVKQAPSIPKSTVQGRVVTFVVADLNKMPPDIAKTIDDKDLTLAKWFNARSIRGYVIPLNDVVPKSKIEGGVKAAGGPDCVIVQDDQGNVLAAARFTDYDSVVRIVGPFGWESKAGRSD